MKGRVDTARMGTLQVFLKTDMRNSRLGLAQIAMKAKPAIDLSKLVPGQYVAFINAKQDRLKLYAAKGIVASYYEPGRYINLLAIAEIPKAFGGSSTMSYDASLKAALEKALDRRARRKKG